jgi:8-oxo-dGTP pyrophosphatase MutT (NUDIX family)
MAMEMTVGLIFDDNLKKVALIRSEKGRFPGLLNGAGGKTEPGETALECVTRELQEEINSPVEAHGWLHFAVLSGSEVRNFFQIDFFTARADISKLKSMEPDIELVIVGVDEIFPGRKDCVNNLPFLISLAYNKLKFGAPKFSNIKD